MEVSLISTEIVKPSSLPLDFHLKPYKLCLFDQINPLTYGSVIVFYHASATDTGLDVSETLARLKTSLSETLSLFYPLSGRPKDNLYVDDFEAGVAYLEANVNWSLAEYFKLRRTELLNRFVPFPPLCNETDISKPQLGLQINLFACGGMAIGTSFGHKIADAGTLSHLLTTWAAMFRGAPHKIMKPNLTDASVAFPPRNDLPLHFHTLSTKMWFYESGSFVTRRFVFGPDAVDAMLLAASSKGVPKPSRNEAMTSFIWKRANAASQAAKGEPKPRASVIMQATSTRPRMKSRVLNTTVGNLFCWVTAASDNAADETLPELTGIIQKSFAEFNNNYLGRKKEDAGFAVASEFFDVLGGVLFSEEENGPEIYFFSNWKGFFSRIDFGWGNPVWVSSPGKVGNELMNMVILLDAQDGKKGIEALVMLKEKHMAALEKDPHFLAFATPNSEEHRRFSKC